jgi:hypothetical protein
MRKSSLLFAGLLLTVPPVQTANAFFRGGAWGGMHEGAFGGHWGAVGGYGHWGAGGVTASGHAWGATGNGYGWHGASTSGVRAAGNYDGWAAVGPDDHWATGSRYYGGSGWYGVHSPAVVNGYYGGVGCYACGGWGGGSRRRGRGRRRRSRRRSCRGRRSERLLPPGRGLLGPAGWVRVLSVWRHHLLQLLRILVQVILRRQWDILRCSFCSLTHRTGSYS